MTSFNCPLKNAIELHLRNDFPSAKAMYLWCLSNHYREIDASLYLGILFMQEGDISIGSELIRKVASDAASGAHVRECIEALRNTSSARLRKETRQFDATRPPYPERELGLVDDWRHCRMLEFCRVFTSPSTTWLTVGDHYGHDAQRLADLGAQNITASSLSTEYLDSIAGRPSIKNVISLNAEDIALQDLSFDYIVCKEAYHHMAKPYQAVYEMLRVARRAVFLVAEPCDPLIDWRPEGRPAKVLRSFDHDLTVGPRISYSSEDGNIILSRFIDWWETGPYNYVYTISEREIAKIAQGYGLFGWAVKGLGDYFSSELSDQNATEGIFGFDETKKQIDLQELLSSVSGIPFTRMHGLLFKEFPTKLTIDALTDQGFRCFHTRTRYLPLTWPEDLHLST